MFISNRNGIIVVALMFTTLAAGTVAQSFMDSTGMFPYDNLSNKMESQFKKQLNTYYYLGTIGYSLNGNSYNLSFLEDYHSTVIQSVEKTVKTDQRFRLNAGFTIVDGLHAGVTGLTTDFSDSRKTGLNETSSKSLEAFSRYQFADPAFLRISGGLIKSSQVGVTNEGLLFEASGAADSVSFLETNFNSAFKYRRENLRARTNSDQHLVIKIDKTFSDGLQNVLDVNYEDQRNDFYFPADALIQSTYGVMNNIQQRAEKSYSLSNATTNIPILKNHLTTGIRVSLWERVIRRNFRYMPENFGQSIVTPDRIDENRIEASSNLEWKNSFLRAGFSAVFNQSAEKHVLLDRQRYSDFTFEEHASSEALKNNNVKRISLGLNSNLYFGDYEFGVLLSHHKMQYDTPSELNFDDRDEMLSILRLTSRVRLSPYFAVQTGVEGNLSKLAYLFGERSANNYTNRVLKLNFTGEYTGRMLVSGNSFEISSFYTVYDYDDLAANVKSFSFRQVSFLDTTLFQFTGHLSSTLRVSYKYSEQAMLFWHRFAVQPLRNIEEIFFHPALRTVEGNFVFAIGYRYMSLTTYKYDQSIRKRETVFRNHGPSAFLSYVIGSKLRVQVDGWLESITRSGGQTLRESNFTVLLLYKL